MIKKLSLEQLEARLCMATDIIDMLRPDISQVEHTGYSSVYSIGITRGGDIHKVSTVDYSVENVTTDVNDFVFGMSAGTLTFDIDEESKTIYIEVRGDSEIEPNEIFNVILSNPSVDTIIGNSTTICTIINDDFDLTDSVGLAYDIAQPEGTSVNPQFVFDVERIGNLNKLTTVNYTITNITTDSNDFINLVQTGILTFDVGVTSQLIYVTINGDSDVEPNETFSITLSNASTGTNITNASAIGTILNDDATPTISIRAIDTSKLEGTLTGNPYTPFTFEIYREGNIDKPASVQYTVLGNSKFSADSSDFMPGVFGVPTLVSFLANEPKKTITINVLADNKAEKDEGFKVVLSNPINVQINIGSDNSTILNDDKSGKGNITRNNYAKLVDAILSDLEKSNKDSLLPSIVIEKEHLYWK